MTPYSGTSVLACQAVTSAKASSETDRALCPPERGRYFTVLPVDATALAPTNASVPLDSAQMASYWALAFTTVVGLYLVSANVGAVLRLIRH